MSVFFLISISKVLGFKISTCIEDKKKIGAVRLTSYKQKSVMVLVSLLWPSFDTHTDLHVEAQ